MQKSSENFIPDISANNIVHSMIESSPLYYLWNALDLLMVTVIRAVLVDHWMEFLIRQTHDPINLQIWKQFRLKHTKENQIHNRIPIDFEWYFFVHFSYKDLCLCTVVFSKHLNRWWCCNSKISSSRYVSSNSMPDSWAARRASAAFFLLTNAAPLDAFAIRMRANRAFYFENISKIWYFNHQ